MKNVALITSQCKELLGWSDIPEPYKAVLQAKYDDIERHLYADSFIVKRCEFLALDKFQKLLQQAQFLHDCPSDAHAYSNLLLNSMAIVNFLDHG